MDEKPFEYAIIEEADIKEFQSHVNDLAVLGYVLTQVLHNTSIVEGVDGLPTLNHSYVAVMSQPEVRWSVAG